MISYFVSFVKTIRSWNSDNVEDNEFAFTWYVDRNLKSGRYFVEIFADDDDDISRSFIFDIISGDSTTVPSKPPSPNNVNKRPTVGDTRKENRSAHGLRRLAKDRHNKRAE